MYPIVYTTEEVFEETTGPRSWENAKTGHSPLIAPNFVYTVLFRVPFVRNEVLTSPPGPTWYVIPLTWNMLVETLNNSKLECLRTCSVE